jgi:hypothetical protein
MEQDTYKDDLTVTNDEWLWRRIPPWHVYFDENLGRSRPSKAAFEDDADGRPMSVVLATVVINANRTPNDVLRGHEGFALAQITAGLARSKQQGVQRDPRPDEPAHALVFGRKSDSARRAFAKSCQWILPPPDGRDS